MLLPRRWIYVRSVCVYVQSERMMTSSSLCRFGDMSCALGVCVCVWGGGGGGGGGSRM